MKFLANALRRFKLDLSGVIALESMIYIPLMAWSYVALSVVWEGYRVQSLTQKATFTISEIISRERVQLNATNNFLNYLRIFGYVSEMPPLAASPTTTALSSFPGALRITNLMFTAAADPNDEGDVGVLWSISTHSNRLPPLTNATVETVLDQIPALTDGDSVVLVEGQRIWTPNITAAMANGLLNADGEQDLAAKSNSIFGQKVFETSVTVRPRFVTKLCVFYMVGSTAVVVPCEL